LIKKLSNKFDEQGRFWHDGRIVQFQRLHGSIHFGGYTIIVAEEQFFTETHYYTVAEAQMSEGETVQDVLDIARRFESLFKVNKWWGRIDKNVKQILEIYNRQMYNSHTRCIYIEDVPRNGEYIDESHSIVHRLLRPEMKRLHFFDGSMAPAELLGIPHRKIRADEFPRATALADVIGGLLRYGYDNVCESDLVPEPESVL
jgi:hypothetical protein